jgi:predicted nucleic acid-binding Zn ribbon protein
MTKLNVMQQLLEIPKTEYERCFQQWKKYWNKCIQAEGAYVKGYSPVIKVLRLVSTASM